MLRRITAKKVKMEKQHALDPDITLTVVMKDAHLHNVNVKFGMH
ncbi:hypothetical protein VCHA50P415_40348 [Vibrio chagasii]|nr:hypothetical protein VCHA50P415_40348 [Vibrio chagasii]